jgi:toxin-antitoxin system PIN domain toxin
MKFLADVNVVFPLLVGRHQHRDTALKWFDSTSSAEVVLPRLTRLGTLRLLTTAQVMGQDVLTPKAAIMALEILESDDRVVLLHEPDGLDEPLKKFVTTCAATPNLGTDAYLAAVASTAELKLVSFDRGFLKFPRLALLLLVPGKAR